MANSCNDSQEFLRNKLWCHMVTVTREMNLNSKQSTELSKNKILGHLFKRLKVWMYKLIYKLIIYVLLAYSIIGKIKTMKINLVFSVL